MTFKNSLLAAMILLLLTACSTFKDLKNINIGSDFEKSTRNYTQLVRWHELESAASLYVSPPLLEAYRQRVKETDEIKIADYRIKLLECDPEKGEATATVELDYYRPPSVKLLTVAYLQKWSYEEENGRHLWRLKTLLPEFK